MSDNISNDNKITPMSEKTSAIFSYFAVCIKFRKTIITPNCMKSNINVCKGVKISESERIFSSRVVGNHQKNTGNGEAVDSRRQA